MLNQIPRLDRKDFTYQGWEEPNAWRVRSQGMQKVRLSYAGM